MPHTICRMQITKDTQSFQFNDVYESTVYAGETLETKIIDNRRSANWSMVHTNNEIVHQY